MTAPLRAEIGQQLAAELDEMESRQLARTAKQAVEYRRRLEIAEAFVHDMTCVCRTPTDVECPKHYLLTVLAGDV